MASSASATVSSAGASSVVSSTSASATTLSSGDASSASSVGASVAAFSGSACFFGSAFLVRAGFGSYFSVTSSITAMGALSPLRGAILVIRV